MLQKSQRDLFKKSEGVLARIEVGNRVGEWARTLWPEGVLIPSENRTDLTRQHLAEGTPVLFEAAFETFFGTTIPDVLELLPDGTFRVWEVKAATAAKKYIEEVAFILWVLRHAGLTVSEIGLIYLDKEVTWDDAPLPPPHALVKEVVTRQAEDALGRLEAEFEALARFYASDEVPHAEKKFACKGCDLLDHCHPDLPLYHPLRLPRLTKDEWDRFEAQGILPEPNGEKMTALQRRNFSRSSIFEEHVLAPELFPVLEGAAYPHVFVDYEGLGAAWPIYPGTRPFQVVPFQWSAHVRHAPGAELEHFEFLATDADDPRIELSLGLNALFELAGTIFTYSSYERTITGGLSTLLKSTHGMASTLGQKELDLLEVMRKYTYHPNYNGSYSIKKVLPAWVPGFNYEHLAIQDGQTASAQFERAVRLLRSDPSSSEPQQIFAALREYCALDTLAMVRIYDALLALKPRTQDTLRLF